jgi:hypothetical protein
MEANRLIRFTVAGWAVILFWPLQAWIIGYIPDSFEAIFKQLQSFPSAAATVLISLMASPVIGFVVSTFAYGVMTLIRPEFVVPREPEFQRFLNALRRLSPTNESRRALDAVVNSRHWCRWYQVRRRNFQIMAHFNLNLHTLAEKPFIDYSTRRWTIYWMYANSICALFIGTILALLPSFDFSNRTFEIAPRGVIELLLVFFVIIGCWRIHKIHREIYEIAWLWLYSQAGNNNRPERLRRSNQTIRLS